MTTTAKATPTGKTAAVKKSAPAGKRVTKTTGRTKATAATKKTKLGKQFLVVAVGRNESVIVLHRSYVSYQTHTTSLLTI